MIEFLGNIDHRRATSKLCSTVKALYNTNATTPRNTPIMFESHNRQKIATNSLHTQTRTERKKGANVRKIKQLELKGIKISTKMVEDAIKSSKKSKALEPDNIAPIHLHFIGKQAIKYQ